MEGKKDNRKQLSADSTSNVDDKKQIQKRRITRLEVDKSTDYDASTDIKKPKSSAEESLDKLQPQYSIDDTTISLSIGSTKVRYSPSIQEFSEIFLLLKSSTISSKFSNFLSEITEALEQNFVFPLLDLPEGPIINILSFLNVATLLDFSTCSSTCKKLSHNNMLWKKFFARNFPEISPVYEPLQQPIDQDE